MSGRGSSTRASTCRVEAVELALTGEVGQRFAAGAACAQGGKLRWRGGGQGVGVGDEPGAASVAPAQHVQQQALGVQAVQPLGVGGGKRLGNGGMGRCEYYQTDSKL